MAVAHGMAGTVGIAAAMAADATAVEPGQTGTAMAVQDAQTGVRAVLQQIQLMRQQKAVAILAVANNKITD